MSQRLDSAAEVLAAARQVLPWMIEIRRDLYMDEESGLRNAGYRRTRVMVRALAEAAIAAVLQPVGEM